MWTACSPTSSATKTSLVTFSDVQPEVAEPDADRAPLDPDGVRPEGAAARAPAPRSGERLGADGAAHWRQGASPVRPAQPKRERSGPSRARSRRDLRDDGRPRWTAVPWRGDVRGARDRTDPRPARARRGAGACPRGEQAGARHAGD